MDMRRSEPSLRTRRRETAPLPRRRKHILAATLSLALLLTAPILATQWFGSSDAATTQGTVAVPDMPVLAQIDRDAGAFPDLLADTVAMGTNPTEALARVDALGNPSRNADTSATTASATPKVVILPPPAAPPLDPTLTRTSSFGPIPGPNAAGRTPLQVYAAKADIADDRRPVAIIIGGLGINPNLTQRAIAELPPAVTLSFAAHAPELQDWIDRARARGHEVLLEIPMESQGFDPAEPGADRTMRADNDASDNRDHLHALLARAQGYAGLINYNGDAFLLRSDAAAAFLNEVDASGLGLFIDGAFEVPSLETLAASVGVPFRQASGLIDPQPDRARIDAALQALAQDASSDRAPIGVGFAYPETIDAVKGWAAMVGEDGLALVPATSTLRHRP